MKKPTTRAACAGIAALLCVFLATPAQADLLFRFYNQTPLPAKGIVQNLSVLWLKPGQNEVARAIGNWRQVGQCSILGCPTVIRESYIANFEHLSDSRINFCTWKVEHHLQRENRLEAGKRAGYAWGKVTIVPTLTHQQPGYSCTVGGQYEAVWETDLQGEGAEVYFFLKKTD